MTDLGFGQDFSPYLQKIREVAACNGDKVAVIHPDFSLSFRQLEQISHNPDKSIGLSEFGSFGSTVLSWLQAQAEAEAQAGFSTSTFFDDVYTSGSTGAPKHYLLSLQAQLVTSEAINSVILRSINYPELVLLPISHSNAKGRIKAAILRGAPIVLPGVQGSIKHVLTADRDFDHYSCSLTPATYRYLNFRLRGNFWGFFRGLKSVEFGSAPFQPQEYDAVVRDAPHDVELWMHFGMTEASRSFIKNMRTSSCQSLGAPMPHTSYGISEEGILEVRGPHLVSRLVKRDGSNSFIEKFQSGDLVQQVQADLVFLGRSGNAKKVGGVLVQLERLEGRLDELTPGLGAVCVFLEDEILDNRVVIAISDGDLPPTFVGHVSNLAAEFGIPTPEVIEVGSIPMLDSGKVDRRKLQSLIFTAITERK